MLTPACSFRTDWSSTLQLQVLHHTRLPQLLCCTACSLQVAGCGKETVVFVLAILSVFQLGHKAWGFVGILRGGSS